MSLKRKATELALADSKKPKADGSITSFFRPPKTNSTSTSTPSSSEAVTANNTTTPAAPPAPKFDKAQWVAKLTDEQRELLKLEIDTLHESWLAQLKDDVLAPSFLNLKRFLKQEKAAGATVYPPEQDIYSWSRHTPLHAVKAVVLGQDPYHGPRQAHGLAFSTRPPTPAPPSLKNVFVALKNDYPDFTPPPNNAGLLTPWADRGVLLLNTCLTVRAGNPNSHAGKGWEQFTQKVIDTVARYRTRGVVFLAWGAAAAKRVTGFNKKSHLVLTSVHPSPLSAARGFVRLDLLSLPSALFLFPSPSPFSLLPASYTQLPHAPLCPDREKHVANHANKRHPSD